MPNKSKRVLVIFTEGPTDEEFYKASIEYIKKKRKCIKYNFDKIKYICANGIGNLHKKMLAKFKFEFSQNDEYKDFEKVVCFCYDEDVFKRNNSNPPIDRKQMKNDFKNNGADKIIEIIADPLIESFFLLDLDGIKKYLKLRKSYKIPNKKNLELLQQMFKDGNRIYSKGSKTEGLINSLDMEKILPKICNQLEPLCNELGYNCCGTKCSFLTNKE